MSVQDPSEVNSRWAGTQTGAHLMEVLLRIHLFLVASLLLGSQIAILFFKVGKDSYYASFTQGPNPR